VVGGQNADVDTVSAFVAACFELSSSGSCAFHCNQSHSRLLSLAGGCACWHSIGIVYWRHSVQVLFFLPFLFSSLAKYRTMYEKLWDPIFTGQPRNRLLANRAESHLND
jgi:hypothetical protein